MPMFSPETGGENVAVKAWPWLITAQNQQGPKSLSCAADDSHTMRGRPPGSFAAQMCRPRCQAGDDDLQEGEMPVGTQVVEGCGLQMVCSTQDANRAGNPGTLPPPV